LENHLLRATKRNSMLLLSAHARSYQGFSEFFAMLLLSAHARSYQGFSEFFAPCTWKTYATTTTSTTSYRLYINFTVHCDYSPPGCMGSTSTSSCAASTRLPVAAALHLLRRTPPRRRLLGVRLPRRLTSTSLNQKTSRGRLPRHQQLVGSTSN
jgi:hypothetical protein